VKDLLEVAQPLDVPVQHGHLGAHPQGDAGGAGPDDASADDRHSGGLDAGDPADQFAGPAVDLSR
jgi:hypothetical protein